jgi:hypothetical protein
MTIDEELPQPVHRTIGATKSMLMVFVSPKEFAIVDLLPQNTSFTEVYFGNNATLPSINRHAQQLENIGRRKGHLYFDNSKHHTARHAQEQMASHGCVRVPHPRIHPTWQSQNSPCLAG